MTDCGNVNPQPKGDMGGNGINIRAGRLRSGIGLSAGLLLPGLVLEMRFLQVIPWCSGGGGPSWPGLAMAVLAGGLLIAVNLRRFVRPRTLFRADAGGLVVSSSGSRPVWNPMIRDYEKSRYGRERRIPWSRVLSVSAGEIAYNFGRSGCDDTVRRYPALRILCDPSVHLEGIADRYRVQGRTGYDPTDICTEDRLNCTEEQLEDLVRSELLVCAELLPCSVDEALGRLAALRAAAGAGTGGR